MPPDFKRTDSLADFLDSLAFRLGALRKGGERDIDTALNFLLKQFREGKLGRWTLDDVDGVEAAYLARHGPQVAGSGMAMSEMGAVGVHREVAAEAEIEIEIEGEVEAVTEAGITPGEVEAGPRVAAETVKVEMAPVAPLPPTLDDRIALTVGTFLARAEDERADADAGRNISATQQKKADMRAKVDFRLAKAKSKGLDKPSVFRPVKSYGYKAAKGGRTGTKSKTKNTKRR